MEPRGPPSKRSKGSSRRPPLPPRSRAPPVASSTICALVESRARETCLAVMNTANSSVIQVSWVQDSQSYAKTLAALQGVDPDEILLHDGTRGRVLASKVVGAFHQIEKSCCRVLFVSRQYFDQDKGAELLKRLASGSVDADLMSKYTALAASYCLIRYIENSTGSTFADASLRVRTDSGGDGSMYIDRSTAKELELITDARSGGQKRSLFGVINHTRTAVGARLLRATILGPCTDIATIEERLDLVTFFLTMEGVFNSTLKVLGEFTDLDRMLSDLVTVPKQVTPVTAGRSIATLICLRHTLRLMAPLVQALEEGVRESEQQSTACRDGGDREGEYDERFHNGDDATRDTAGDGGNSSGDGAGGGAGSPLLKALLDNFLDRCLEKTLERLDSVLTDSTSYTRNPAALRHEECFAVRADVDGMLDVARTTFLQSMEDIYQAADAMSEEHGYQVKVSCSVSRGYHLIIPAGVDLPPGLIQAVQNTKTIACTTEEVSSLSDRANEAVRTALLITHDVIQTLADEIRTEALDALFAVTESVALLDMIFGFADLVTLSPLAFCRPEVTADGPMSIRGGRHPIVGAVQEDCKFIPNDTYMSPFINFQVVTGPNNSGKSTYLKQAGLIVLMAQMGCYVPAEMAVIPVRTSLLSRIGTGDDLENNVSTFLMEMREIAQVLERVTSRSLVSVADVGGAPSARPVLRRGGFRGEISGRKSCALRHVQEMKVMIDELGRGTSNREGLAVAWAVAEQLLSSSAYTLFVTHYSQMPGLADLYPNVENIHLQTALAPAAAAAGATGGAGGQTGALRYLHKALDGRCDPGDGYGIRTAEMCGLPREIVEEARVLRTQVIDATKAKEIKGSAGAPSEAEKDAYELLRTLATLKGSTMDPTALREFLHVLSLEYGKGPKGARILASLHPSTTTHGTDAARANPPDDPDDDNARGGPSKTASSKGDGVETLLPSATAAASTAGTPGGVGAAGDGGSAEHELNNSSASDSRNSDMDVVARPTTNDHACV